MPLGGGVRLGGEFPAGDFSVRGRRLFFQAFARLHPSAVSNLRPVSRAGDFLLDASVVPKEVDAPSPDQRSLGSSSTSRQWLVPRSG